MTYLLCQIFQIDDLDTKMKYIKKAIEKYELKKFDLTILKKVKLKDFYTIEKFSLLQFLKSSNKESLHFKEIEINYKEKNEDFDDLDKMNKQLKLVILGSNIKLSNFGLNESNKSNAILKILNINDLQPAVSSSISGLAVLQLFNLLNDSKVVDFIMGGKEENNIKEEENKNRINEEKDKNEVSCFRNTIFNLSSNIYLLFELNNI